MFSFYNAYKKRELLFIACSWNQCKQNYAKFYSVVFLKISGDLWLICRTGNTYLFFTQWQLQYSWVWVCAFNDHNRQDFWDFHLSSGHYSHAKNVLKHYHGRHLKMLMNTCSLTYKRLRLYIKNKFWQIDLWHLILMVLLPNLVLARVSVRTVRTKATLPKKYSKFIFQWSIFLYIWNRLTL